MMKRIRQKLRAFRQDNGGVVAFEFALFFPVYMGLFLWAIEAGLMQMKAVLLDHALDVSIREVRLGIMENPSQESLKTAVCSRARILDDCEDLLMIELRPVSTTTWDMPATPVTCVATDEDMEPVVATFDPGRQNEIMLVRACVIIPVHFPNSMFGRNFTPDSSGGIGIAAVSAFVNEPS